MAAPKNRNSGFSRRAQAGVFFGYVVAVSGAAVAAVVLAIQTLDPSAFGALRGGVAELTTPLSSGLAWVGNVVGSVPRGISEHVAVVGQNTALRNKLRQVNEVFARAQSLERENKRLRALLGVRDVSPGTVVTARLVSSSASSTRRFATLNAGFRQGVAVGQPVRGPEGLIGRVLEVGPDSARILLLSDPESIVPVRRSTDGLPAIATGRGDGLIDIKPIALSNTALHMGDLLTSSGVGGLFPPDIPVARIIGKTRDGLVARGVARADTFDIAVVQRPFLQPASPPAATP